VKITNQATMSGAYCQIICYQQPGIAGAAIVQSPTGFWQVSAVSSRNASMPG
jgi:hypothetical protein